jgi:hypothetical protein
MPIGATLGAWGGDALSHCLYCMKWQGILFVESLDFEDIWGDGWVWKIEYLGSYPNHYTVHLI